MSDRSPWQEVVRSAALEAAIAETIQVARSETAVTGFPEWSEDGIPFNYRWEHVQAVVRLAVRLAELTGADREIVETAAWLHDIAKGRSKDHAKDGAVAARRILVETDFPPGKIDAVADAIAKHRGLWTTEPVEPLEAAVLWDADKLSKLGATAVLHFAGGLVTYGRGTTAQILEELPGDDWIKPDWQEDTVRSFHTAPARAAARRRWEAFRDFCQQAVQEFDGDDLVS
ncbi:MAG: HD domain-containing protein [Anaerolineae bacterium]